MPLTSRPLLGLAALALVVTGCASGPTRPAAVKAAEHDLAVAVRAALQGDWEANFFDAAVDLDGDGVREMLAYVAGPMVCGTGGCSLFVFTPGAGVGGYRLIGRVSVTRAPVRLSPRSHNGWRNLVVHVGGGGGPAGDVELHFDGRSYPSNPSVLPAARPADLEVMPVLIPDFGSFRDGKPVPQARFGDPTLPAVATVLGMTVHTRDAEELRYAVQKRLSDRFADEQGIVVKKDEIVAYVQQVDSVLRREGVRPAGADTPEDRAAREQIAAAFIRQWKLHRALYRRYGGRIIFQQGGPEPLDAWRRFLEESQARGDFALLDRSMEAPFWRYFVTDAIHSFYPPGSAEEARAFDTPPWAADR